MNARLSATVVGVGMLMAAVPVLAHHSFAAEFDANSPITLRGTLTKMEWVNPHGWLHLDVKGPDGKVVNWGVEAGGPNALLRRGLRKEDFPIGTELIVEGFQSKNGSPNMNGRTVKFPDGRNFFVGSSGNGAPTDGAEK